jgi:hypothetical protein
VNRYNAHAEQKLFLHAILLIGRLNLWKQRWFYNDIVCAVDAGEVAALMLDLSAGFDTVDHSAS